MDQIVNTNQLFQIPVLVSCGGLKNAVQHSVENVLKSKTE